MSKKEKVGSAVLVVALLFFVLWLCSNKEAFSELAPADNVVKSGSRSNSSSNNGGGRSNSSGNNSGGRSNSSSNNGGGRSNSSSNNSNKFSKEGFNMNNNMNNNTKNVMFGEELQGNVSNNNNNLKGTPGNVVGVSQNVGTPLELVVSTDPNKMQVDSLTTSLAELQSPSNNAVQMKPNNNNNNNNNMYSLENNLNSNVISNNGNNNFNNMMNNGNISMPVPTNSIGASASGMVDQASPVNNNNNNNNRVNNNNNNNNNNRVNNNNNNNNRVNNNNNRVNNNNNNRVNNNNNRVNNNNIVNNNNNNNRVNNNNNRVNNNNIVNNNNNNNRVNNNNNNNNKKFRITLVHAKWCGFCKKAKPEWDKLVAENPFPNVELRDIEDTNKEELAKYKGKVKGFPTFIVEDMSSGSPVYVNQFNAIDREKMTSKIKENIN